MSGKKTLAIIVSLIILASGVFSMYTYSGSVKARANIDRGVLPVASDGFQSINFQANSAGMYYIQINASAGAITAFFNVKNLTDAWISGQSLPSILVFNGSSGQFTYYSQPNSLPNKGYIIFSNPDSFNKEVSYNIYRAWTYNNYFALITGIALTALGAIIIFLTLLKNKLKDFNKALENQE